jgi:hypothetical protein
MKNKAIRIIALLGAIFLTGFAVVFTLALATGFAEPYNMLSWLFLAVGLSFAAAVWYYKKREENTQELLKAINPENLDSDEREDDEPEAEEQPGETEPEAKDEEKSQNAQE